jgi:hypothetical protein
VGIALCRLRKNLRQIQHHQQRKKATCHVP